MCLEVILFLRSGSSVAERSSRGLLAAGSYLQQQHLIGYRALKFVLLLCSGSSVAERSSRGLLAAGSYLRKQHHIGYSALKLFYYIVVVLL